VPQLLDEVHWLHENRGVQFALCGSSARKVRRGHANLLGGSAIRYELFGLTSSELGPDWNMDKMLNHGYLPRIYSSNTHRRLLNAYTANYLEDTFLGRWLPAYRKRPKRRVVTSPKFYFSDVGVVNFLAKRGFMEKGSELYGKAFENWLFHEISAHNMYNELFATISYWRLSSGIEVDFIINDMEIAIDAKSARKITANHLKGLRQLRVDHPEVKRLLVVCCEHRFSRSV